MKLVAAAAAVVAVLLLLFSPAAGTRLPALRLSGNRLVQDVAGGGFSQHRGLNSIGALYACLGGWGIFDSPAAGPAYIATILNWSATIVRLPINQDCWLGASYLSNTTSGAPYQTAVVQYIHALVDSGLYVIVELHWTNGGSSQARQQWPMPDPRTPDLWRSVAGALQNLSGHVVFDLFNEPFPNFNAIDDAAAWACWKNGGSSCSGLNYTAVGFQLLVDTVRATGARNLLLLGGINYANDLSQWLAHMPDDPATALIAGWHSYSTNYCNNPLCWVFNVAPTMAVVPVIAGEIGENDCGGGYITPLMAWLDGQATSYLAWTFITFDCRTGPGLITDYSGTCTQMYGCTYYNHLHAAAQKANLTVLQKT